MNNHFKTHLHAKFSVGFVSSFVVLLFTHVATQVDAQSVQSEKDKKNSFEIEFKQAEGRVDVLVDDKCFTSLVHQGNRKPFFYPVKNPSQQSMTRSFPMQADVLGEQHDHPHHKSVWFSHDIDGVEFWQEKHGRIAVSDVKLRPSRNSVSWRGDWLDSKNDRRICQDQTEVAFAADTKCRSMDYQVTIVASDGDIELADSKEGSFAVRVHPHLRLDAAPKAGVEKVFGAIENDRGLKGKSVWGKRAKWVMYSGEIHGKPAAIVIFDHPRNLRHPTTWHARGYGLFAANPFGLHHFEGRPLGEGGHKLKQGERLTLRYQAIFFNVIPTKVEIEKRFQKFALSN
jgi:hypothetical protein